VHPVLRAALAQHARRWLRRRWLAAVRWVWRAGAWMHVRAVGWAGAALLSLALRVGVGGGGEAQGPGSSHGPRRALSHCTACCPWHCSGNGLGPDGGEGEGEGRGLCMHRGRQQQGRVRFPNSGLWAARAASGIWRGAAVAVWGFCWCWPHSFSSQGSGVICLFSSSVRACHDRHAGMSG
jgi:hypothetical protein